jgi:hypothetical protein
VIRRYSPLVAAWEQRVERRFHSPRDYLDAARSPDADVDLLFGVATVPFDFVHEAIAEHPNATAAVLATVVPEELRNWGNHSLLRKVISHPAADEVVLALARARVAAALAAGRRPYGVAIALAQRGVLTPEDVETLGALAGASARLRHGLRRAVRAAEADRR